MRTLRMKHRAFRSGITPLTDMRQGSDRIAPKREPTFSPKRPTLRKMCSSRSSVRAADRGERPQLLPAACEIKILARGATRRWRSDQMSLMPCTARAALLVEFWRFLLGPSYLECTY